MSDIDDILAGDEPVQEPKEEVTSEPKEAEPVETPVEAEEPKQEVPEEQPEKEPAMVPVSVLKELREDRREAREQIARLEKQIADASQPKPEPAKTPDVFADPNAYTQHMQNQTNQAVTATTLNMSELMARDAYGDEKVDQAFAALEKSRDRFAYQRIMQDKHPYRALVNWHGQQQLLAEIGNDPDAWREKERERIRAEIEADVVAKQVTTPAPVAAPSMADETGSGGNTPPEWAPASIDTILR